MNSGRRIAAAVLTAALSIGAIGFSAGPAEAYRADTSWPAHNAAPSTPQAADTSLAGVSQPLSDTSWPV